MPWHVRRVNWVDARLRGEGAATTLSDPGKHTIAHLEPLDVGANGNNFAREFVAQHKWKPWPLDCAKLALSEFEIDRVQTRSAHLDENITWPRRRCRDFHQPAAFRAAVMLEDVCAHRSRGSGFQAATLT